MARKSRIEPKFSHHLFFERSRINNIELWDIKQGDMQNDNDATFLQLTNTHIPELFGKQTSFENRPKVTPIERQSIYNSFLLEVARKSRIEPKFSCHLFFERSQINNTELRGI